MYINVQIIKYLLIATLTLTSWSLTSAQSDSVSIYLVKQRWHTGVVFSPADADSSFFPEVKLFKNFKYIDVGWGDDEFYRHPDFDAALAFKALFYSTPTVLRVEGFNFDIMKYIGYSDIGYEVKLDRRTFDKLTLFISSTFYKDNSSNVDIVEKRYSGNITFYRALGRYTAFNTCNTWVAKAFDSAGIEIKKSVILAEELFDELKSVDGAVKLK
jgi:uncharacterized protein (TIGR02117 family)